MILYDYPLSEQVRTFLRLKALFRRALFFMERSHPNDHHAALGALFDILDVTARTDVKSDLMQSMERQRASLSLLRDNINVDQASLEKTLGELDAGIRELHAQAGKLGDILRSHEWLMAIKQRICIPGGTSDFDLPAYHYWQSLDESVRQRELNDWFSPYLPLHQALQVHLRLLLDSGRVQDLTAAQGNYQQSKLGPEVKLLRVGLKAGVSCVPEISANKYLLNIRFLEAVEASHPKVYAQDVPFRLMLCTL